MSEELQHMEETIEKITKPVVVQRVMQRRDIGYMLMGVASVIAVITLAWTTFVGNPAANTSKCRSDLATQESHAGWTAVISFVKGDRQTNPAKLQGLIDALQKATDARLHADC